MKPLQLSQLAFFLVLTATGIVHAQNNNGPEMAPALPGVELAPQALLGGARHTVQEPIKIEGYFGRFVIESLSMLAELHNKGTRLTSIRMHNFIPVGRTGDGTMVAAVAIDYGVWDKDASAFAQDKALGAAKKTLLVSGKLSALTQQGFEQAGWTVKSGLRS